MTTDNELLKEYARSGSESAITQLVQRHVNLIYSAALRETGGNAQWAEELTQESFSS